MGLLPQISKAPESTPRSPLAMQAPPLHSQRQVPDEPKHLQEPGSRLLEGKVRSFEGWPRLVLMVLTMLAALSLAAVLLGCGEGVARFAQPRSQILSPATHCT